MPSSFVSATVSLKQRRLNFPSKSRVGGGGQGIGGRVMGTGGWELIQKLSVLTNGFSKSIATIKKLL